MSRGTLSHSFGQVRPNGTLRIDLPLDLILQRDRALGLPEGDSLRTDVYGVSSFLLRAVVLLKVVYRHAFKSRIRFPPSVHDRG